MGGVWELDLDAPKKLVLLAMADHADHEGRHVRPSLPLIAWKTGYSPRQVQRIVHELVAIGILHVERIGTGRGHPTHYRICLEAGVPSPAFRGLDVLDAARRRRFIDAWIETHGAACYHCGGAGDAERGPDGSAWHVDRIIPAGNGGRYDDDNMALSCAPCNKRKGANMAPFSDDKVRQDGTLSPLKGAIYDTERVPSAPLKGAIHDKNGGDSFKRTVKEPSLREPPPQSRAPARDNGAAAAADAHALIDDETAARFAAQFTQLDPTLTLRWFNALLTDAAKTIGQATTAQVATAAKTTHAILDRRLTAERAGSGQTIANLAGWTRKVFIDNLTAAVGAT